MGAECQCQLIQPNDPHQRVHSQVLTNSADSWAPGKVTGSCKSQADELEKPTVQVIFVPTAPSCDQKHSADEIGSILQQQGLEDRIDLFQQAEAAPQYF